MDTPKRLTYSGYEVDSLVNISKSTRYAKQDPKSPQYDPSWPLPVRLSARSTGYLVSEIEAWLASRPRTRVITQGNNGAEFEAQSMSRSCTSSVKRVGKE